MRCGFTESANPLQIFHIVRGHTSIRHHLSHTTERPNFISMNSHPTHTNTQTRKRGNSRQQAHMQKKKSEGKLADKYGVHPLPRAGIAEDGDHITQPFKGQRGCIIIMEDRRNSVHIM